MHEQDLNQFREVVRQLKEPFPPELHTERDLPGGQKWLFISWQNIRARLDEVCPEWQVSYGMPTYLDKHCVVSCKLTICGVTREALGNAETELLSKSGKDMSRGTPIERAIADAFKNAAEAFGVAAYLDEQSKDKREFLIRHLHRNGDSRGLKYAKENGWVDGNLQGNRSTAQPPGKPRGVGTIINEKQVKRFYAIARNSPLTPEGISQLLAEYKYSKPEEVKTGDYNEIIGKIENPEPTEPEAPTSFLDTKLWGTIATKLNTNPSLDEVKKLQAWLSEDKQRTYIEGFEDGAKVVQEAIASHLTQFASSS